MLVASYLLRRRNLSWQDLGLRWPQGWWKTIFLTGVTFLAIVLVGSAVSSVAGTFFEDIGVSGRFDNVEGNVVVYLGMLVLVWVHSAFFEELLFRAFVINRATTTLGNSKAAVVLAVIFAAVFFGYRHYYYQGMKGAVTTGAIGLALGLLYVWFGRKSIMPLVLGHGIVNTIIQTQRFIGGAGD
jgi:membrane protease YdiL (CAAX protease family)